MIPATSRAADSNTGKNKKDAAIERKRLSKIIEDLVLWENTDNEAVLEKARAEIRRSWREVCELNKDHPRAAELFSAERLPALHDPFAGGGSIPLEPQRLGLESYASDLNPVAVLIIKSMMEIPPKLRGRGPVGPALPSTRTLGLPTAWPGSTSRKYVGSQFKLNSERQIARRRQPDLDIAFGLLQRERPAKSTNSHYDADSYYESSSRFHAQPQPLHNADNDVFDSPA